MQDLRLEDRALAASEELVARIREERAEVRKAWRCTPIPEKQHSRRDPLPSATVKKLKPGVRNTHPGFQRAC